ncbi:hypothetical protein ABPG74_021661 [Tetrahymena malaccensis]
MEADQFIKCQHNNIRMSLKHQGVNSKQKIENHKDLSEKKSLKEKFVDFYFTEFDLITKRYKRGKLVSFLIFSLFQLQQISLLYNQQVQDLINSNSSQNIPQQFYTILSYSRIDPLINDLINLNNVQANLNVAHLSKYITLIFFLLFSLLFLIHMAVRLILYLIYNEHQTVESHLRALHQNSNIQNQKDINSFSVYRISQNITFVLDNIASVYYQLVLFVFYIPSVQIFSEIYNDKLMGYGYTLASLSFFNLAIQLLIVFIYTLHDYDYEISFQDHLSKRDSLWSFYHLFAKGVMATFYNTSWGLGISTIHWVLKLIEVIEIFVEFPYHEELIRKWNCLYLICHFTFSFVAYLYIFLKLKYSCNISIIYLVAIPIAMLIGELIYRGMQNRIKHVFKNSKNPAHVDLYIRYLNKLFDLEYNKYTQLKYGVDFESLYTSHIISCNDLKCFCSDFQYKPFKWENFIQSDDRTLFLQGYVLRIRLNYIGNEDFGVCGQITRIRDIYSEFILLDKDLNISDISKKLYKIAFQNVFEDDRKKMKKINLVRMIPLIGVLVNQNHQDQDKYIESAMMIIPQSQKQINFFRKRETSSKEVIQKYLKELNYSKHAFFEISLQYLSFKSSYGNTYRALEIKKIRKIKSQESKLLLITDFVDNYNRQFLSSLTYEQNDIVNSSTRYFDNNTFVEQSQLIASTMSFKTSKQSKQNKDQQSMNIDLQSTQKSKKRSKNGDLFNQKLGLQKVIKVEFLVNHFIQNLKREVLKKKNQRLQLMQQQNIKQLSSSQLPQKSQFMRESLNKTPQLLSMNSKILSDSNILKRDTDYSNNINKKNSQQVRTLQHLDNVYNLSLDAGGGDKEECVISINYLGDNVSQRGTELMIQNQDSMQKANINSPLYADRPILSLQNNSNIPLGLWNSAGNEFSARQDYQIYLENNLNSIDYDVDILQDQKNKTNKESRFSNYIQNNEDFASPSTKEPSSVNQQLTNKKSLQYFASISFKSPRSEEPQDNAILEEPAQLFTPHLKSDNQIISRMPEQKFYDQVGVWEYNKVYSSQLESLSPVKRKQSNYKHRNTLQLSKQQNDVLNGNFNKIKSLLIDEFEQEVESEDEDQMNKTRTKNNTQTIYDFEIKMKQKMINDQNSVKSALSQQKSKKYQVINKITTKTKPILIFSIELTGIVSFFFMLTVTTGIFIYLNTIFQQNVQNFHNLLTGPYLSSDYASLMKEYNSINLFNTNQFPYLSGSQMNIKDYQEKLLESFTNGVKNLFDYRSDASYSNYVNTNFITVDYLLMIDKRNVDQYFSQQYLVQFLINYSTLILQTQMYYLVQNTVYKNSIRYSEKNLISYFQEFQIIQNMANDQSVSRVNTMQKNIITTIAIMEVVAFFILIIAIPIYYKIQTSRENWMRLFATQSQDKLQEMINRIDLYIMNQQGTFKQLEKPNFKRKTVSSIVGLKKYNMKLIIFIAACLILVSIYPIINLIYAQNFKNEFNYQISEIELIVKTRAQFNTEFALILIIANSFYKNYPIDQNTFNFFQQVHQNNTQTINQLYYLSEQFTGNRFNKNEYQDLLINSLNQDVCDSIKKYPQYYPTDTTIDILQCQTVYNQIFTQGMITTLKILQDQFQSFKEIVQISNQNFQQQFQNWAIQVDLNSLLILQRQLSDYLEILQIFLIRFNIFVKKLTTSLYKTRNLLTLFKVDYIIDNSYMMTFLSDQIQKGKVV